MRKYQIILFFFLSTTVFSQANLSDYSYVVVPEQYEFLKEKDEYQLNSLSLFLFEKFGFNPYYALDLPNVDRCDGLYAEVDGKPGFLNRSTTLILKDCEGNEVYRSIEGRSGEKDYKIGYHEALRRAFNALSKMDVDQKDPVLYETKIVRRQIDAEVENGEKNTIKEKAGVAEITEQPKPQVVVVKPIIPVTADAKSENDVSVEIFSGPSDKFSGFKSGETYFLLRKTESGYGLYEETEMAENGLKFLGTIINSENKYRFIEISGKVNELVFDKNADFEILKDASKVKFRSID